MGGSGYDWKKRKKKSNDILSTLGPTKKFLESRGLTNVNELDEKGLEDLRTYLEELAEAIATD